MIKSLKISVENFLIKLHKLLRSILLGNSKASRSLISVFRFYQQYTFYSEFF